MILVIPDFLANMLMVIGTVDIIALILMFSWLFVIFIKDRMNL